LTVRGRSWPGGGVTSAAQHHDRAVSQATPSGTLRRQLRRQARQARTAARSPRCDAVTAARSPASCLLDGSHAGPTSRLRGQAALPHAPGKPPPAVSTPHPSGLPHPRAPPHQGLRPHKESAPREVCPRDELPPHDDSPQRQASHPTPTDPLPRTPTPRTPVPTHPTPHAPQPPHIPTPTHPFRHTGTTGDEARRGREVRAGPCGGPGKPSARGQLPGLSWPIDNGGQRGVLGHSRVDAAIP
jgi:hypothetical protein